MDKQFIHLHLHTEYSLLDGATRIPSIVKKCMDEDIPAVAMTDHGNMYAACTFFDECNAQYDEYKKQCSKKGIPPTKKPVKLIIGCEFYVCDDITVKSEKRAHLILLAKNDIGYKNLSKLNAIAFRDGFYYKPRIDYNVLSQYSEGIICLSACIAGDIPQLLLHDLDEEAEKLALRLKNMFAEDDFYIEVQNHHIPDELYVLPKLFDLAKKIGVKTVATNDVHYLNKDDKESQDILLCIQTHTTMDDTNRFKIDTDELYFKSYDEMYELFKDHPECLDTTVEIANKCNFAFDYGNYKYPKYIVETGEEPLDYLKKLIEEGLNKKYKVITKELRDRVDYELGIINKMGFVEYYLIVWDYINAARKMNISVGPGRGSGAGSVVAYAIGITNIDPLKYELYFERFLNPERVSAPDFDVDFEDSRRQEVIDYVRQKYGDDRVIKIITFGTMAAKNAIKDVGRALKIPYSELDKITKAIPNSIKRPYILKQVFGMYKPKEDGHEVDKSIPELVDIYKSNDQLRKVIDIAIKLEDMPRQTGIHACGVIIGKEALDNFDPLSRNEAFITTQYTGPQMEHLGHLKMDFLGLCNLSDIYKCVTYVKENYGIDLDLDSMGCDEKAVYEFISSGNTKAVFQIESPGFRKFLKELKPTCLEDIIAGVSLYRPGPMDSIPKFIYNKNHPDQIVYDAPCLEPILNYTYGCIVYQEQVMKIVQDMAGYSLGQADNVRRMMGKKQVEKMAKEKDVFIYGKPAQEAVPAMDGKPAVPAKPGIDGAIKRGVSVEIAEKIWGEMANFAKYAFNKSHAAAYSIITYQTAYLKLHYEAEFLTAVLNNRIEKPDDLKNYITHAKEEKITVLPPDINYSDTYFTVKNNNIRFGLAALKNIGSSLVDKIVEERKKNGNYKDIVDFIERTYDFSINKRTIESLIYSGAMDCFGKTRSQLISVYEGIMNRVAKDKKVESTGQISMFDSFGDTEKTFDNKIDYPDIEEYNHQEKLKHEKEIAGIYISGHPLDKYLKEFSQYNFSTQMIQEKDTSDEDEYPQDEDSFGYNDDTIKNGDAVEFGAMIVSVKKMYTKLNNKEMAVLTVEDLSGSIDVMVFPKVYSEVKDILLVDNIVVISGKYSERDGESPIILLEDIRVFNENNIPEIKQDDDDEKIYENQKLGLIFNTEDEIVFSKIDRLLSSYKGKTEVFVKCTKTNRKFRYPIKVRLNKNLLRELCGYLEEKNVRLF